MLHSFPRPKSPPLLTRLRSFFKKIVKVHYIIRITVDYLSLKKSLSQTCMDMSAAGREREIIKELALATFRDYLRKLSEGQMCVRPHGCTLGYDKDDRLQC
jgi:hypothetical protein